MEEFVSSRFKKVYNFPKIPNLFHFIFDESVNKPCIIYIC